MVTGRANADPDVLVAQDPLEFYGVALDVLDCIAAQYEGETLGGLPGYRCVIPGEANHNRCCDGQLTVSMMDVYPYKFFPDSFSGTFECSEVQLAMDLKVLILRCAPKMSEQGVVRCEDYQTKAQITAQDAHYVLKGIACCFGNERDYAIQQLDWIAAEGLCTGSETMLTVAVGGICCGN